MDNTKKSAQDVNKNNSVQDVDKKNSVQDVDKKNSVQDVDKKNSVQDVNKNNSVQDVNKNNSVQDVDKNNIIIIKNNTQSIYGVFHTLMSFVAIYLSFKCNNNSFNIASFIMALCCPYVYIIYILSTKGICSK